MQKIIDVLDVKTNVSENPVKRTYARLRHPMRAQVSNKIAEQTLDRNGETDMHVTTKNYAMSAAHGVIKQAAEYFQTGEGAESLQHILVNQGDVVYGYILRLLSADELKVTSHMAGQQIVMGACDGMVDSMKLSAQLGKLPEVLKYIILPVAAIFIVLFMLGLLLAMWRFALFGLQ